MPAKKRNAKNGKSAKKRSSQDVGHSAVTLSTPDGTIMEGMYTTIKVRPTGVHRFQFLVAEWKVWTVSVGISPIQEFVNFRIADIPQITALSNTFDSYRIRKVVCVFKPRSTQFYWGNSSGQIPVLSTAIDYNDGSGSGRHAIDYSTAVSSPITAGVVRSFSPKLAMSLYNGPTSSAYAAVSGDPWLDCLYPSAPYYQLVVNISDTSIDNQFSTSLSVLYDVEFRNTL